MAKRRYRGGGRYKMTARRRAALKKAQAASARKRRRRGLAVAGGVLGAAALGGAIYAGSKQPGGLSGVYRTGKASIGGLINSPKAKAAHQPSAQEATRIAGAVSPASAPRRNAPKVKKPKATQGATSRTNIPKISSEEQSALMKEATKPRGPSWMDSASFNEDGTVSKNVLAGISKELLAGQRVTAQQAHSALARSARATGKRLTTKQRSAIVNQMIAEGTVSQAVAGTKTRGKGKAVVPKEWIPDEDYGFD